MTSPEQTTSGPKKDEITVAITGATGFVGKNLIDHLLDKSYQVKALTRRPPEFERKNLSWVSGDLDDMSSLQRLCDGADTVIHLAGLTKAITRSEFFRVNRDGCSTLAVAAQKSGIQNFILLSSLAAREPKLSHYGASKNAGETILRNGDWSFRWCIIRPAAIYGPFEKEIYKALKFNNNPKRPAWLPSLAGRRSKAGFIHVYDLCSAFETLISSQMNSLNHQTVELDDGTAGGYTMQEIADAMLPPLRGNGVSAKVLYIPFFVLAVIGVFSDLYSLITRKATMTSLSHMRYLSHDDWSVNEEKRARISEWLPKFRLKNGFEQTIEWYRNHKLL